MTKLTEEMVIARSRQSDLASIKKLNCWGSDLSDVSIIRRMRGVEVLALSVNKISTLQDFEDCRNLQELYLRKNNIQDINEIAYLQSLPNLKYLWLEENPCCENVGPSYRAIVLRALPNLKKLDNIEVTPEEVQEAMRMPIQREENIYEDTNERTTATPNQQQQQNYQQQQPQQRRSQSPIRERSPGSDQESSPSGGGYKERGPIPSSMSSHSMKEYYQSDYQKSSSHPSHYRHSQSDLTELDENHSNQYNGSNSHYHYQRRSAGTEREMSERYGYRNGNIRDKDDWDDTERLRRGDRRTDGRYSDTASVVSNAVLNHYAGYHRRPVNRSSNLLSATLCLVKELDYPSLEVVEHAVRCRIDELSAD